MKNWLIILGFLVVTPVLASDIAKEKRWEEQTVDSILDGEPMKLKAGAHEFLAIYTESEEESDRAIIVVHGTGIHPDWSQIVQPVRVELTQYGWNTLSIQMPILANDATYEQYVPLYPEVPPRLQAAEAFLKENGMKKVVIVAHSQGATMSSYYLANSSHNIDSVVLIGMSAGQKDEHINGATSLSKIKIPVLDLIGSEDLPAVLETNQKRQQAAAHNKAYEFVEVKGANHFFDDHNEQLIEAISGWLK